MSSLGSDRFELLRQVGEGSSGVVYEARDLYTATTVAIKVLHRDNDTTVERFEREVAVLAELNHPAIVRYVAHGITEDKRRYLAMEWLEGLPANKYSRGPWSVSDVLVFARRIVAGLAYASSRGVVHRDIKPGNLLLVDGSPANAKIVDFGLARFTTDRQRVTRTGAIVGTPAYMSPEQARGERDYDTRTDVFSLGSVLYRCLCGLEPFLARETLAVLAQICFEDPLPIEERTARVPRQLATLVEMMLRKNPRERPSWRAISDALADIGDTYRAEDYDSTVLTQTGTLPPLTTISPPTVRATALPRRPRAADHRILAALFVGATGPLPATLDLELHALITRFGARVERLIDGSRIVLPGQQLDASEQTQVAARCALSLRQLLSERAPIVVCTGRAVIGDHQPLGKLFDRGAALLAKTPPGVVRVDEASASLLESRFELGGVDQGGQVLERERSGGEAPRTVLGRHTPFVGRDRELQQLQLVFTECCDELVARAVLVTAPPGAGKSRLRHELFERLRASNPDFFVLAGRGDAMRVGTQFSVLAAAIQTWAELATSDSVEVKQNKLRARMAALLSSDRAAVATQFLAEMIGIPYPENLVTPQLRAARRDHQLMVDQLLACWLEWLEALDRDKPVLLCVEDLQWSDPASIRFIEVALRSSRDRALMVLAFARPEVRDAFPQLWAERDLIEIRLPKLGAKACARILDALRGLDVTPALQSAMIERADGNPFFLEELVRGYTASAGVAELPDTILAILQSRLDTLGEEPKRLIQAASIFGESFRLVGVKALLGEDDITFDYASALGLLCDREIIFRTGPVSEQEYAFRHGLIRDAAYELQHEDDRQLGHRLAAGWLERNADAPAVLADHYERGGVPASAAIWWARAASQAFEAGSSDDALRFGERAVACGIEGEAYGMLAALIAEVHSYREAEEPALTWAQRARACVPVGSVDWWRATRVAAVSNARRGWPDLSNLVDEIVSQFSVSAEMPEQVLAVAFTTSECARLGLDDVADRLFALLPAELPESMSGRAEGAIETARAVRAYRANNFTEALRCGERAVEVQRRGGATRDLCDMLGLCGYFALWLGAHSKIEAFMHEQLPLGERIGHDRGTSYGYMILGIEYLRQGRYDKAVSMLALAMIGYEKLNSVAFQVETYAHLTMVHCATGELTRAHEALERAARLDLSDAASHAYLLASTAHLARIEGRPEDALVHAKRARELMRNHDVQEFRGVVMVSYVESLLAVRDYTAARTLLEEAEQWLNASLARIDDPAMQRCFLENIPEHRRIRELRAAHVED